MGHNVEAMTGTAIQRKNELIALGMVERDGGLFIDGKLDLYNINDLDGYSDEDWQNLYDRADQYTMKGRLGKKIAELERENQWLRDRIDLQVAGINARDKELAELRSKNANHA